MINAPKRHKIRIFKDKNGLNKKKQKAALSIEQCGIYTENAQRKRKRATFELLEERQNGFAAAKTSCLYFL